MKTKLLTLTFLLSSCGGGGSSGGASSSPIAGSWLQQFSNPSNNISALIGASSFSISQATCTITGVYTIDANIAHVSSVSRTSSCVTGPSSFDCSYNMPSNNQLQLFCPGLSADMQRQ